MALLPFRRKSYSGILQSEKIHQPWLGLNPRTSDPVTSMITTGPPGSSRLGVLPQDVLYSSAVSLLYRNMWMVQQARSWFKTMYRVPEKSLTISGTMLIFVSLLYVIWKILTTEQWINILSWRPNGLPFAEVQEHFRPCYHTETPTRTTIRGLVNKFQWPGNICEEKRSGWLLTSQETVETMRQAIEQSPKVSTRHLCPEHGIPKSTVW